MSQLMRQFLATFDEFNEVHSREFLFLIFVCIKFNIELILRAFLKLVSLEIN